MKALTFKDYGDGDKTASKTVALVNDYPVPFGLEDDEVKIEVHAASLNPIDLLRVEGALKQLRPEEFFPAVVGYDAAGVITEIGKGVTTFKVGDRVFVRTLKLKPGSIAEYMVSPIAQVAHAPARDIPFTELAGVPLAGQTALQALRRAGVTTGKRVFISGGAGGVGTFAIQIAKLLGASYVATTGSAAKADLLKSLGADIVVDYKTQNFLEVLPHDFDAVFDTTKESAKSVALLKEGVNAQIITVSDTPTPESLREVGMDPNFIVSLVLNSKRNTEAEKAAEAKGGKWAFIFLKPNSADLSELAAWLNDGKLRVIVDSVFPLDDAVKAVEKHASGRATGKVIIQVRGGAAAASSSSSSSSSS